ncbi:MAG: hypothetical protein JWO57_1059 [Pseudonocardiales bacterium]|nr:hypothetical protein [Pseudonocardiales bacterium]
MSGVDVPVSQGLADELAAVVALRRLADRLEHSAVEQAMRAGWSWQEVAEALGVTRQAVHKKHAKRLIAAAERGRYFWRRPERGDIGSGRGPLLERTTRTGSRGLRVSARSWTKVS